MGIDVGGDELLPYAVRPPEERGARLVPLDHRLAGGRGARLDHIEEDAYSRNIPLSFSDLFYTLREHINLVRAELTPLESKTESGT